MEKSIQKHSLQKNFIFQFFYQVIILIIPLVLSPYLTRKLGDSSLGVFSFVNSIAYYFILFANLGIAKHGQRIIAQNIEDKDATRRVFWSLYILHAIISVFVILLYSLYILIFVDSDISIYWIELIYVASALFDITWLFYGIENFKSVVIKNALIKLLECVLVFVFVKQESDLYIYTIITASSILLGQIIMLPQAIKLYKPIKVEMQDIKTHIKPLLLFSISVFAVSLYTVFDKTLLGIMTNKENVAYYEYANKIVSIPRTFITIIGTVMFPRACKMAIVGNKEEQDKYLNISLLTVMFIGFGSLFGLIAISNDFSILYFGENFKKTGYVMLAMCSLPLIVGLGDIVRTQYMIPNKMDKLYTICIIINAILNLIVSILLIPVFDVYGVVIGSTIAELFGCIFQLIACRKYISIKKILKYFVPFCISGAIMLGVMLFVSSFLNFGWIKICIEVSVGATVYLFLSFSYILLFEKSLLKSIIARKKK